MSASLTRDKINLLDWIGQISGLVTRFNKRERLSVGWKDMLSPLTTAGVPSASAPSLATFGTTATGDAYEALEFSVNEYAYAQPFHANHDITPNGQFYLHVHWSTNGTNTNTVKWQLTVRRAKGHNQASFGSTEQVVTIEGTPSGTAWQHMVSEMTTPLYMTEPDELILVTIKRITNGGTDNTDSVFGLNVDFHYQSDRDATPQKAPNFYV